MKLIEKTKRILFAIVRPDYWAQNRPYNAEVDKVINELDWNNIKILNKYEASVDGMTLWIANHPYYSFHIGERLPSRLTRYRLMKKIEAKLVEHEIERLKKAILDKFENKS